MAQLVHPDRRPCAADALSAWGATCLRAVGVDDEAARSVAGSLVQTSLRGIDSHGIARLPHYLNRIEQGSMRARPNIVVTPTGPCTAQVAGDRELGIVVARRANEAAMQMARTSGIGAVGVSDSSHCGAVGLYSRAAAQPGEVLLPGDPELAVQAQRCSDGIPVEPGMRAEILLWSERLKVAASV